MKVLMDFSTIVTCDNCKAILKFSRSDIKKWIYKKHRKFLWRKASNDVICYVTCPLCGNDVWLGMKNEVVE